MDVPDSRRPYYATAAALLALLGLSIGLAFAPLGRWGPPVSLGIAAAKALLVALVFMHLRRSSGVVRLFAAAGLAWLGLLFALSFTDFAARGEPGVARRLPAVVEGEPAEHRGGPPTEGGKSHSDVGSRDAHLPDEHRR